MKDKQAKYPQLRFKGFTDPWEQRKLENVILKLSGGASIKPSDYSDEGVRTIPKGAVNSTGVADLSGSKFISREFFEKNKSSHASTNNLVTSLRDLVPSAPNMGRIVRIEGEREDFLMPQGVYKLELFDRMDEEFLIAFSNSDKYRKIISVEKNGSTQVHIRNGEFLNIDIELPTAKEQQKIGAFFKQLDHLITLHQRKLVKLKELKQGYLQKMFPKNGAKVPELRFAGFADAWEQRKLSEVVNVQSGKDYKHLKSGDIPVYGTGGYMTSVSEALSDKDAIGIGRKGTINKPYILSAPFWTVDTLFYAVPKSTHDLKFVYGIFQCINWKKFDESTGVPSLSKSTINSVQILEPMIQEQSKIGTLLNIVDTAIALHQRKLDLLKEQKKGFLQKMFV